MEDIERNQGSYGNEQAQQEHQREQQQNQEEAKRQQQERGSDVNTAPDQDQQKSDI